MPYLHSICISGALPDLYSALPCATLQQRQHTRPARPTGVHDRTTIGGGWGKPGGCGCDADWPGAVALRGVDGAFRWRPLAHVPAVCSYELYVYSNVVLEYAYY